MEGIGNKITNQFLPQNRNAADTSGEAAFSFSWRGRTGNGLI